MADVARLHKLVRKADGLQDFQRAGLNASGTADMTRPDVLIDNTTANVKRIKICRNEEGSWTCTHHQYLGASGHHRFGTQQSSGRIRGTKDYGTSRGHSGFAPENS